MVEAAILTNVNLNWTKNTTTATVIINFGGSEVFLTLPISPASLTQAEIISATQNSIQALGSVLSSAVVVEREI
jgi:hypothetical protein